MKRDKNLYLLALRKYERTMTDGDYIKDDVLYCANCNTPRAMPDLIDENGNLIMCACECRDKRNREIEDEEKKWEILQKIARLKEISLMDERYSKVSFVASTKGTADFENAMGECKDYCTNARQKFKDGKGLYIYGKTGMGKTHISACMANDLLEQGFKVKFTNINRIIDLIYENDKAELQEIKQCDFLFLDDFGKDVVMKNNQDTWLQSKIYNVINDRYIGERPVIITSNCTLSELMRKGYDVVTVDRIREMCEQVEVKGDNWR
jgi:DNA replication protein DnaC